MGWFDLFQPRAVRESWAVGWRRRLERYCAPFLYECPHCNPVSVEQFRNSWKSSLLTTFCFSFFILFTWMALWTSFWIPGLSKPQASGWKRPSVTWKRPSSSEISLIINKKKKTLLSRNSLDTEKHFKTYSQGSWPLLKGFKSTESLTEDGSFFALLSSAL